MVGVLAPSAAQSANIAMDPYLPRSLIHARSANMARTLSTRPTPLARRSARIAASDQESWRLASDLDPCQNGSRTGSKCVGSIAPSIARNAIGSHLSP